MRFVPIKSEAQHEVQALHRVREQLLREPHGTSQSGAGPARGARRRCATRNRTRAPVAAGGFSPIPEKASVVSVVYFAKPCKKWPSGCASSTNGSVPTMTESSECLKRM